MVMADSLELTAVLTLVACICHDRRYHRYYQQASLIYFRQEIGVVPPPTGAVSNDDSGRWRRAVCYRTDKFTAK